MPKRRRDGSGGGSTSRTPRPRRRHLYLVLDGWSFGYRIRKVDLSSFPEADDEQCVLPSAMVEVEA